MTQEIKMPQLSDTMDAGKILSWKKRKGDKISRGDILAEVETDKANLEIESFFHGTLLEVFVNEGSQAKVGEVIAILGEPGESVKNTPTASLVAADPKEIKTEETKSSISNSAIVSSSKSVTPQEGSRLKVSPLAKKIAESKNIDLTNIHGTGPNGRIVRNDLIQTDSKVDNEQTVTPAPANSRIDNRRTDTRQEVSVSSTQPGQGRLSPLSKMRETIAKRMQEAVTTAPHFYTTVSVDMDNVVALKDQLKADPEYKGISINHFVIKAVAHALKKEPRVNRAMKDGMQYDPDQINIGIITAVEDGLLIPVIKSADQLRLKDLIFEAKSAVDRARAGRPNSSDLLGGTFSISNMGMFNVENFTAIINPGQGAVLAVSSTLQTPVVKNSQVVIGNVMKVTLSVDHRVIDGIMSGLFLKYFKEGLENPALLFL